MHQAIRGIMGPLYTRGPNRGMNMSKKRILVSAFAAATLFMSCICLVGCGMDYTSLYAGTWRVTSMQDASGNDLSTTIQQLKTANHNMTLTLEEDKNASFDMAGQLMLEGRWKPTGETVCSISFDGYDTVDARIDDSGKLTFEEDGQTMTCEKQE
jgi:hypothetical protein